MIVLLFSGAKCDECSAAHVVRTLGWVGPDGRVLSGFVPRVVVGTAYVGLAAYNVASLASFI